jgi:hypothetical protein
MKRTFYYLITFILLFSLIPQYSFSKEEKNKKIIKQKILKVGDTVDGSFLTSFEPLPKVGLTYTFISTSINKNYYMPSKEESTEVISMSKDYVTLLISSTFEEPFEKVVKLSDIKFSGIIQVKFKYEGLFDVKVPFKNFPKATKVSVSNKESDLSIWLVKGIGVVKLVEKNKLNNSFIVTELKNFRFKTNRNIDLNNSFY